MREAALLRRPLKQRKSNTENSNQRPGAQCHRDEGYILAPVQIFHEGQVPLRPFCSSSLEIEMKKAAKLRRPPSDYLSAPAAMMTATPSPAIVVAATTAMAPTLSTAVAVAALYVNYSFRSADNIRRGDWHSRRG